MSGQLLAHLAGDYIVQSSWMANEKTRGHLPAALHGATYAACFLPLTRDPRALLVIGGTHWAIDHWRLARHVVWAKNQLAPAAYRYRFGDKGPWGAGQDEPAWLHGWLLFLADNSLHGLVNAWALRRWGAKHDIVTV